jgi:hypothetical protein
MVVTGAFIDIHAAPAIGLITLIAQTRVQTRVHVVHVRVVAGLNATLNDSIPTGTGYAPAIKETIVSRQGVAIVTNLGLLTTGTVSTGASRSDRLAGFIAAPARVDKAVVTHLIILHRAIPTGSRYR